MIVLAQWMRHTLRSGAMLMQEPPEPLLFSLIMSEATPPSKIGRKEHAYWYPGLAS
jgi:hypothetical protein